MKLLVVGLLFIAASLQGCARNHFNVPAENFAAKVKVLGVAPIMLDADSDINYPQRDLLIPLVADLNRKYEPLLTGKLKGTGDFFAVTPLADEPRQLFASLMSRREKRDDAGIQYNKYFWKNDAIGAYIKKNRLDAVMVVVVSGLTKTSKIYASNLLTSLETDFNFLTMTAQILGEDGTVLWEYPNFRGTLITHYPLVNLQYPDFSESEANLSRSTALRFKSLDGIRRTLEHKKNDWLLRETQEPEVYGRLFDEMTSLIRQRGDRPAKTEPASDGSAPKAAEPAVNSTPSAPAPSNVSTPGSPVENPAPPSAVNRDVVPATEGAR